jgi:hypothetical protein
MRKEEEGGTEIKSIFMLPSLLSQGEKIFLRFSPSRLLFLFPLARPGSFIHSPAAK